MLHFFYFISVLVALLPSISSIPRVPHYELFFIVALGISFVVNPITFLRNNFTIILILLIFHFIYQAFDIYNEDNARKFTNFIVPVLISNTYFDYYNKNIVKRNTFLKVFLAGLIITAITTSFALQFFPDAARAMAGALSKQGDTELINFYLRIGIGGYAFSLMWALTVLFLIFIFKNKSINFLAKRYIIILIIIQIYALYIIGFTTPLLLFFIAVLALPFKEYLTDLKRVVISLLIVFLSFSFVGPFLSGFFYFSADVLQSEFFSPRLINIAMRFDGSLESTDLSVGEDTKLEEGNRFLGGYEIRAAKSLDA